MMKDIEKKLKKELGEGLKQNIIMKELVSFGVGGVTDFYYAANNVDDLVKAVSLACSEEIPYFILGGGYNIVPSDVGFGGLVIENKCSNIAFSGDTSQVIVDSGLNLGKLINSAASREFGGLEFLFGVPGTVGGAVYGNAGAFGYEIGDFVKSVILLISQNGKVKIIKKDKDWMNFSYRLTRLKEAYGSKNKPVILTVKLQLVKRRRDEILKLMQENLKKRQATQPIRERGAGCFFKNSGEGEKVSAGYLLDKAGGKKLREGGAAFSKKHANFLINKKDATACDIRKLADKARDLVKKEFNIELEEEIEYIGKW